MADNTETAILAGGCAWIMQQLLRHPDGVISTRTGFMGGENENPTEENDGGHAEVVEVVFDPELLSYRGLLEVFFQVHRPDLDASIVGSLYRSEIFCTSTEQRRVAEDTIRDVDASGHWPGETVTKQVQYFATHRLDWAKRPQGRWVALSFDAFWPPERDSADVLIPLGDCDEHCPRP